MLCPSALSLFVFLFCRNAAHTAVFGLIDLTRKQQGLCILPQRFHAILPGEECKLGCRTPFSDAVPDAVGYFQDFVDGGAPNGSPSAASLAAGCTEERRPFLKPESG